MAILDPTATRLSPHFLLSDFMGCASVYSRGLANVFDKHPGIDSRLSNAKALCEQVLEPLLALSGSFSISYGFISPEVSREIVTYQNPDIRSHHRWDLGAAADICIHRHVLQSIAKDARNDTGAPIAFALEHMQEMPLSRLITYSESPYMCVAVSAQEVEKEEPRMAWYENRYTGKPKTKPDYRKYASEAARQRAYQRLDADGLDHPWVGKGYPTYHGGGRKQLQHIRTSKNTMAIDWLFDAEWVETGRKNLPALNNELVAEAFQLAGETYDQMLDLSGLPRLSIVSAYTSHQTKGYIKGRDWRGDVIEFEVAPPEYLSPEDLINECSGVDADLAPDGNDRVIVRVRRP